MLRVHPEVLLDLLVAVWLSGNALALINVVALRRARLVLGWVAMAGKPSSYFVGIPSWYLIIFKYLVFNQAYSA